MKRSIRSFLCAAALFLLLPATATASAQGANRDAVDRAMKTAIRAFETGDPDLMFEVLRKDAIVIGYSPSRGSLVTQTGEEWAKGLTGVPADEAQRKRSYEIVDVAEDAAVVRLRLDYPGWNGLDYLALSNIEGRWMIVSKSWSGTAKQQAVAQ